MESLLLRGRMPIHEDALTAALADLLQDIDDKALVAELVSRVRAVAPGGMLSSLPASLCPGFDAFSFQLWPSWPGCGEPDLLLTLTKEESAVAAIVIEVKYESTKSGEDTADDDSLKDQLGRYAKALEELYPEMEKYVVYLTGSSIPPTRELEKSWIAIKEKTGADPAQTLRWLSWRDIDRLLRKRLEVLPQHWWGRTKRVLALLERAGLRFFDGWPLGNSPPCLPPHPAKIPLWLRSRGRWRIDLAPSASPGPPPSLPKAGKQIGWHM